MGFKPLVAGVWSKASVHCSFPYVAEFVATYAGVIWEEETVIEFTVTPSALTFAEGSVEFACPYREPSIAI